MCPVARAVFRMDVISSFLLKLGNLFASDAIMIRIFGNFSNKDDIFIKIPIFRPYCNLSLVKHVQDFLGLDRA